MGNQEVLVKIKTGNYAMILLLDMAEIKYKKETEYYTFPSQLANTTHSDSNHNRSRPLHTTVVGHDWKDVVVAFVVVQWLRISDNTCVNKNRFM